MKGLVFAIAFNSSQAKTLEASCVNQGISDTDGSARKDETKTKNFTLLRQDRGTDPAEGDVVYLFNFVF